MMILRVSLIWTACGLVIGQNDWMLRNPFRSLNQFSGPFLPQPLKQLPASQPSVPSFLSIGQPQFPSNQLSPKVSQAEPPNPLNPYRLLPPIHVPNVTIPVPPLPTPEEIKNAVLGFIQPPNMVLFGNKFVKFKILENLEQRIDHAIETELKDESETLPADFPGKLAELVRPEMKKVAESIRDHIEDEKKKAEKWLNDSIEKWLQDKIPFPGEGPIPPKLFDINGTVIVGVVENYLEENAEMIMDTKNELIQIVLAEAIKPLTPDDDFTAQPTPLFPWTTRH